MMDQRLDSLRLCDQMFLCLSRASWYGMVPTNDGDKLILGWTNISRSTMVPFASPKASISSLYKGTLIDTNVVVEVDAGI